ncbi:BofC C-terminal domain-containing protein [[Brevibacterium] frigoritolerans]|uniref:BofC C-terminal domain-containing protein n=1 Tax=Peribacillus frigoritolerans TaxID=450367 RepID=A0A941FMZ5_9BACI|nr:BofC C-terminal domain-containing protein [Peribacillus frigoritolerans]
MSAVKSEWLPWDEGRWYIIHFIGRPEHAKIIHTFYQIDVGKLEAYKQEELQKGIPIMNKDQYKQLIKEYEPYSVN